MYDAVICKVVATYNNFHFFNTYFPMHANANDIICVIVFYRQSSLSDTDSNNQPSTSAATKTKSLSSKTTKKQQPTLNATANQPSTSKDPKSCLVTSSESYTTANESDNNQSSSPEFYAFEQLFESKPDIDNFLRGENCWAYRSKKTTIKGKQTLYRCNMVRRKGEPCKARIYTLHEYDDNKDHYQLFRLNKAHTHQNSENKSKKPTYEVKRLVIDHHKNGKKPKSIAYALRHNDVPIPGDEQPTIKQIYSIIKSYTNSEFGADPLTMNQLQAFVESKMPVPYDEDTAFVMCFDRSPSNEPQRYFRIFVSTPRLLRSAADATTIHADATHKVTTERLPLLVVGSTDMTRKFHLIGITLASRETTEDYAFMFAAMKFGVQKITTRDIKPTALVSDADPAIHNGFRQIFDIDTHIMCYAHVMGNVDRKYKFSSKKNKNRFQHDLRALRKSYDDKMFDTGCKLFMKKWKNKEVAASALLEKSFFHKNNKWYHGSAYRVPKTNNALERFNGTMKQLQTFHKKLPLKQFKERLLQIVEERSKEYLMDKSPFTMELNVSDETLIHGCELPIKYMSKKDKNDGTMVFFVDAEQNDNAISMADIKKHKHHRYSTFDEFKEKAFNLLEISFGQQNDDWKNAKCTCNQFQDKYMCLHIIAIGHDIGIIQKPDIEPNYDDQPLFRPKLGRPMRATPALQKD